IAGRIDVRIEDEDVAHQAVESLLGGLRVCQSCGQQDNRAPTHQPSAFRNLAVISDACRRAQVSFTCNVSQSPVGVRALMPAASNRPRYTGAFTLVKRSR